MKVILVFVISFFLCSCGGDSKTSVKVANDTTVTHCGAIPIPKKDSTK